MLGDDGDRWGRALALAAVGWALAVGILFALVPVTQTVTTSGTSDGVVTTTSASRTLIEAEGFGIVVVLLLPVAVAAVGSLSVPVRQRRAVRLVAGWALLLVCVLSAASIGIPYVPAAVLLLVAAARTPRLPAVRRAPGPAAGSA